MGFKFRLQRNLRRLVRRLPGVLLFAALAVVFVFSVDKAARAHKRETVGQLEESIRRAAMVCYALEGRYPESLSYLKGNYGIMIDEEKFTVYYDIFASNIMPEIFVVEK
ncbi:MAG TPA: hypothetical protein GXZ52_02645 [Clostridiales bacterium]|jgi:methyl coenzyme M reductase beta subunit|nr:hypothetical protein [Clostridiales bacterium]